MYPDFNETNTLTIKHLMTLEHVIIYLQKILEKL
jgi:hypothetical protein